MKLDSSESLPPGSVLEEGEYLHVCPVRRTVLALPHGMLWSLPQENRQADQTRDHFENYQRKKKSYKNVHSQPF